MIVLEEWDSNRAYRFEFTPLAGSVQTTEPLFTGSPATTGFPNPKVVGRTIARNERGKLPIGIEPLPQLAVRTVKTFSVDKNARLSRYAA